MTKRRISKSPLLTPETLARVTGGETAKTTPTKSSTFELHFTCESVDFSK